jgi:hypothetical protein
MKLGFIAVNQDSNKSSVQYGTYAVSLRKEVKIQTSASKVMLAISFNLQQLQVL